MSPRNAPFSISKPWAPKKVVETNFREADVRKKILIGTLLACLLLLPSYGWGAIAGVGSPAGGQTPSGTACTITYSPTKGNFLGVWVVYGSPTQAITSVTDNGDGGGSTYASAFNDNGYGGNWTTALFYTMSAASSVTTISANVPTAGTIACIAAEFSGVTTASAHATSSARATGSSNTQKSDSITPTAGIEELMLGYFFQNFTQADFTQGGSWNLLLNQDETSSGANLGATYRIVVSTIGSYTADATTGASVGWAAYISAFKAAVGGGAVGHKKQGSGSH